MKEIRNELDECKLVNPIWRASLVGMVEWQSIPPAAVSDHEKEALWALAARYYWKVDEDAGPGSGVGLRGSRVTRTVTSIRI